MTRRFPLRRGRFDALRLFYGATDKSAYVEVDEEALLARFGFFRMRVPRADIAEVDRTTWPWWLGSGWRVTYSGALIVGPPGEVVRVRLRRARWTALAVLPWRVRALYLAVEDTDGLIAAIASTA